MTGLRIVGEHEFKHHAGLDVDKYTRQPEVYAAAVHISPADALMEIHDEPMTRRMLMVGQHLRGSSKAMTGIQALIDARNAIARSTGEPEMPSVVAGLPWHEDKGSWSEFLLDDSRHLSYLPPSKAPGPMRPNPKRVARDHKKAKLAKASRKRNR